MAILSSRSLDNENAKKYGILALETAIKTKDWHLIASSNIMLGNQFFKNNDFNLSLKYYLVADSLYTLNKEEDRFLANSYDNISSIYTDIKDKKALIYLEKSNEIYRHLNDKEGLGYNYILKGIYYNNINEHKQAIINFEKAIVFYQDYGDVFRLIDAQTRLINSYSVVGNYKKAEVILKDVEENLINSEGKDDFVSFYLNGGKLYLNMKQYNRAIDFFNKAYKIINKNENNFFIAHNKQVKKGLTDAYSGKKDYKNAFKYSQLYLQVNDSIYKKNNIAITKELETKYQSEKKEQEIVILKSENKLVEQQKLIQRNQLLGVLSLTALTGIFFFFLYRNRRKTTIKLQELDIAKSSFFTNISHEFRTPLTLISGPIQQQLNNKDLSIDERTNFEMANRNTNRLLVLVDQILDISKVESGNLKLKVTNSKIIPLIGAITDSFLFTTKQKGIDYKINKKQSNIDAWFDRDVLEKIITNLISNAVKYTPENGKIECNIKNKKNKIYFIIKNSGKGMSKEQLEKVFNRFYQINEDNKGTGIGLALVKELVLLHKGTIDVKSVPNNWTTFTVKLPITKKAFKENEIAIDKVSEVLEKQTYYTDTTQKDTIIENDNAKKDKPILLIVDDNIDIRTYITSIFKSHYTILQAENGQKGIDIAIQQVPDIIISDIMMPIKNGIELCNTLKVDERTSHIPIILLTAKAGEENEIEGIKTGADDYITKPFNNKLLTLKVEKLLENIKKLQERFSQEVFLKSTEISISSTDELFLNRLQDILDAKLVESTFNTEVFCKSISMSRMQLHRKLKALFNMTTSEFIRSQRLKLAADLLKNSDVTVSQVGYSVGFNDPAYFSKRFKETYNYTPTQYAKRGN